jgi:hypothetical protein
VEPLLRRHRRDEAPRRGELGGRDARAARADDAAARRRLRAALGRVGGLAILRRGARGAQRRAGGARPVTGRVARADLRRRRGQPRRRAPRLVRQEAERRAAHVHELRTDLRGARRDAGRGASARRRRHHALPRPRLPRHQDRFPLRRRDLRPAQRRAHGARVLPALDERHPRGRRRSCPRSRGSTRCARGPTWPS